MLEYTGHPLFDVGVATILAFVGKDDPEKLTEGDLDKVAEYLTTEYTRQPLKSFLTVAFPNSGFNQPAFEKTPERRLEYARRVLQSYRADTPTLDEMCIFTGEQSTDVALDDRDKLEPGRAYRQHIPLLTGENIINFHPDGQAGLPVSGKAIFALQAAPLGCAKCGGRLLAVHSDNQELILHFAASFLQENRKAIQLTQASGGKKMPEARFSHRTLLVDTLLQAKQLQQEALEDQKPFSITAYHLSNSGQGPKLDIYHLPLEMIGFLREMQTADLRTDWNQIVHRAWEVAPPKKGGDKESETTFQPRRNWLYEDLFGLPDNALRFLRTYFLRIALRYAQGKTDPRTNYSLQSEANLVSWKITERFLRRILHMEKERIEQIRNLGDRLADYVSRQNDRRFFREFFTIQRYDFLRNALIKANLVQVRQGREPLITLDPYIEVFEEGSELAQPTWRLARDLVLIRMVERLHEKGWLSSNVDAIPEETEVESE